MVHSTRHSGVVRHVSVAICTWNRARLLAQTLEQMRQLKVPEGVTWELIVVDNNSTDETETVLAQFAAHLPLQGHFEPRQGKSHACNRAVGAARGDLLLWTDDDVLVEPDWLAQYVTAANELPMAAFFGGPISAQFEVPPPVWLVRMWPRVAMAYAVRDLGQQRFEISDRQNLPFGANFAVRTAHQRNYPYDPNLGPRGALEMKCEETEMLEGMLADGHRGFWIPTAQVRHFISAHRLTREYLDRYYYGMGQTQAVLRSGSDRTARARASFWTRTSLRALAVAHELKYRGMRLCLKPELWAGALKRSRSRWGQLSMMTDREPS